MYIALKYNSDLRGEFLNAVIFIFRPRYDTFLDLQPCGPVTTPCVSIKEVRPLE